MDIPGKDSCVKTDAKSAKVDRGGHRIVADKHLKSGNRDLFQMSFNGRVSSGFSYHNELLLTVLSRE